MVIKGNDRFQVEEIGCGYAVFGDCTLSDVFFGVSELIGDKVPLIISDPPYGGIVKERWDQTTFNGCNINNDAFSDWMVDWTRLWKQLLFPGGAFYVWGGIGKPGFRPFFCYLCKVEQQGSFELANLITWKKLRGRGIPNYLFTREECAYFINGNAKLPRCFNVPLLDKKRGYAGYNKKYPAKSEYYRRTNVWTDINELLRNKVHPTQKPQRLHEVMVEVHTQPGEWVIDPFAGSGTTALACMKLDRRFVVIENDRGHYDGMLARLRANVGVVENA